MAEIRQHVNYTMPQILVEQNELQNIKESIDKILKSEKPIKVENRVKENAFYGQDELTEGQKLVLKYVESHPGTTKEDIVRNLGTYSRVTIFKLVESLLELKMLIIRHIQHIFANNEHILLKLIHDLGQFKKVYFELINQTNKVFRKNRAHKE